jgi:hypothetical protein
LNGSAAGFSPAKLSREAITRIEIERRRDSKRRQLIERELRTAAWQWGGVGGGVAALSCLLLLLFAVPRLSTVLIGKAQFEPRALLWGLGLLLSAFIVGGVSRWLSRHSRRAIVSQLSKMPYEDLLRRCAR